MTDIDFEELDQAVNNIAKKKSADPSPKQPKGRFMDVVHPSSDMMKKNSQLPGSGQAMSHDLHKTLTPISSDMTDLKDGSPALADLSSKAELPTRHNDWPDPLDLEQFKDVNAEHTDNPDTVSDDEETEATEATNTDDAEPADDKPAPEEKPPKDTSPPSGASLFLPNTEVEKRPLGGVSNHSPASEAPAVDDKSAEDATSPEPKMEVASEPAVLPPEFESNLVAIEESESTSPPLALKDDEETKPEPVSKPEEPEPENIAAPKPFATPPAEAEEETDDPGKDDSPKEPPQEPKEEPSPWVPPGASKDQPEEKPDDAKDRRNHKTHKTELSGLLAAGSIPQQYKSQPVSGENPASSHPIFFDADHYGQTPGAKTQKKRSKASTLFQWLFIVVGLLLLGASIGAALFLFVSNN